MSAAAAEVADHRASVRRDLDTFELGVRLSIKFGTRTDVILEDPIARSVVSPR